MVGQRKRLEGVLNIIRFNWHQYIIVLVILVILITIGSFLTQPFQELVFLAGMLILLTTLISLFVSYYVYDCSDLYELNFVGKLDQQKVLNINAGFDEISALMRAKYPDIKLTIADFYNPDFHTEVSIKRARKRYSPQRGTIQVETTALSFPNDEFDKTISIFSAHEIRNQEERICFLKELRRVSKRTGEIIITEHLRDIPNFLAYSIGFLHFYSRRSWINCFEVADLKLIREIKTTNFVTTFVLSPHGTKS